MSWAIEEYAEDAIVAYLNSELPADLLALYTAWTGEEIKYPCAVVKAGDSNNATEGGFTGHREIEIQVAVMTEDKDVGELSSRLINRKYRDEVIKAFAQTTLHDDINALVPFGVVFSQAYVTNITRSVESDLRLFVSEITLTTVASPLALT